jgi:L-amino acid N-acyltransferase YncA
VKIRPLQPEDWPSVRKIYQEGIETGFATFETETPDWETWNNKFILACRLILEYNDRVIGWAVLSPVSKRYVYRGVAEVTIYRDLNFGKKGIGSLLM